MLTVARALVLVVPVLAALACGGRVDGPGSKDDAGDDGGSCPPATSDTSPPTATCNEATEGCTVSTPFYDCNGAVEGYNACQCIGGGQDWLWTCTAAPINDCNPEACAAPSIVALERPCSTPGLTCGSDLPELDCSGAVVGYESCTCVGGSWSCPELTAPSCPDGGGPCPEPVDVVQDAGCFTDQQQCPGNPQQCGSEVLYDAFECVGGLWQDVAATVCDVDAG